MSDPEAESPSAPVSAPSLDDAIQELARRTEPASQNMRAAESQTGALSPNPQRALGSPPSDFSRGVNDYLNHYVAVVDAKAAGALAAALTVGGWVTNLNHNTPLAQGLAIAAIVLLSGSIVAAALALIPRLPHSAGRGVIFWEQVRLWPSGTEYLQAVSEMSPCDVEKEYAEQNLMVSHVLHRKNRLVRQAIQLFLAGLLASLLGLAGTYA